MPVMDEKEKVRGAWLDRHNLVLANGGLHVIGSERHESRRIDNQLRGRSGGREIQVRHVFTCPAR